MVISDTTRTRGYVVVREYDVTALDEQFPGWRECTAEQRLQLVERVEPASERREENTTCVELHEWIVDCMDPSTTSVPDPNVLEVGRSSTTPQTSDTTLNDGVDKIDITRYSNEGSQIRMTTFIGEQEANVDADAGETLSEAGVWAGTDSYLLNHSLLPTEYEKTSQKTMTVEAVLVFASA